MQRVVLEEPYEFVPPIESDFWVWLVRTFRLKGYLKQHFAIDGYEIRGAEKLRASVDSELGVVLAPNHNRLSDPLVMGWITKEVGVNLFAMASWHLFKEGWYQRALIRRMGAFSVYREGNDRQSVNTAIDILVAGRRPLVIFPEGAVSRHQDLMMDVMDGPAFIARQAAKRREKEGRPGVVIHPVAIRYAYHGDLEASIVPELERFEHNFSWQPQSHLSIPDRIRRIAEAILAVKEVEYLGESRRGDPHERAERLIVEVLTGLETKWGTKGKEKGLVGRIKAIRSVILPDLIDGRVSPDERDARWRDLAACYYLQQIAHYPPAYLNGEPDLPHATFPERIVETVERLYEDFDDRIKYNGPMHCTMVIGDPIEVSTKRDRAASAGGDPAMRETHRAIQAMLDGLIAERREELVRLQPA
ncbi:MAG: 1-acyl-sn-glycerol-3-phosphate acyltransferase [Planctomycetota bacterium]